jgi:hypothetical protein
MRQAFGQRSRAAPVRAKHDATSRADARPHGILSVDYGCYMKPSIRLSMSTDFSPAMTSRSSAGHRHQARQFT